MKVLKDLFEDDLVNISDFLSNEINKEISFISNPKEIIGMDVNVKVAFDDIDKRLDVDTDVDLDTDSLSNLSEDAIGEAVDRAYKKLDNFIDAHFKVDE
jgi:hypothetical protein